MELPPIMESGTRPMISTQLKSSNKILGPSYEWSPMPGGSKQASTRRGFSVRNRNPSTTHFTEIASPTPAPVRSPQKSSRFANQKSARIASQQSAKLGIQQSVRPTTEADSRRLGKRVSTHFGFSHSPLRGAPSRMKV